MVATGIFFVPQQSSTTNSENTLFQTLTTHLTTIYNAIPLARWSLEHRLFRDTNSQTAQPFNASLADDIAKAQGLRYLQVLSLSHHPGHSYVAVTTTYVSPQTRAGTPATSSSGGEIAGEPATIVAIPSGAQSEEFLQLILSKFGPLWSPRQLLQVSNGQAFETGDFRIRIGEVRQGHGSVQQVRGIVAEIQWTVEEGEDLGIAEGVIQAFWQRLDIKGAREYVRVVGAEEDFSTIRQWCESLRIRS